MVRLSRCVQLLAPALLGVFSSLCLADDNPHSLPQAIPGTTYAAQLAIPPGLGYPFAKCELVGQAPRWLALDCARLQLKGRVPAAGVGDSDYQVTLRIEDGAGNARSFPLTLRVSANPQVVNLVEPDPDGQTSHFSSGAVSDVHSGQLLSPPAPVGDTRRNSGAADGRSASATAGPIMRPDVTVWGADAGDTSPAAALSAASVQMRRSSTRNSPRRPPPAKALKTASGIMPADGDANGNQPACPSADTPNACAALDAFRSVQADCSEDPVDKTKCTTATSKYQALIDAAISDSATLEKKIANLPSTATLEEKSTKETEAQEFSDLACDLEANRAAFRAGTYTVPAGNPPGAILSGCYQSSPYFRGLLGGVYSAASSTDPQFKLLANLAVDLPIGADKKKGGIPNSQTLWLWGYTGVGSLSQQTSVIDPSQISASYAKLANAQPSQIVQSFEMNAGVAVQVKAWQGNLTYFDHGSFSLIAGGGALTPLSPSQITSETFSGLQASLVKLYPTLIPTSNSCDSASVGPNQLCYISYYPQDRSRFYSQYEAGLRVKLYPSPEYLKASPFPAVFDATVGQNEYVTGGGLDGVVLHVGGSSPISPIPGLYAFGGMDIGINNRADQPINVVLTPFTGTLPSTVPVALKIIQPPPNRDRYSLGFGLDVLQLLRTHQLQDAFNKNQSAPPP